MSCRETLSTLLLQSLPCSGKDRSEATLLLKSISSPQEWLTAFPLQISRLKTKLVIAEIPPNFCRTQGRKAKAVLPVKSIRPWAREHGMAVAHPRAWKSLKAGRQVSVEWVLLFFACLFLKTAYWCELPAVYMLSLCMKEKYTRRCVQMHIFSEGKTGRVHWPSIQRGFPCV